MTDALQRAKKFLGDTHLFGRAAFHEAGAHTIARANCAELGEWQAPARTRREAVGQGGLF